ncbi:hypothetical protein [Stenotrophomonas sp.]|uniref:hypothetical protein n=1 Tax=Stenotrophomonas sp. TaxID=69392 RepID=UPI0028970CC3|nr:hypothetical protein [Stenotrophomonas sp.]
MDVKTRAAGLVAIACYLSAMVLSAFEGAWVAPVVGSIAGTGVIATGVWLVRSSPHIDDEDEV